MYNVEKYLEECLQSVTNQTFQNLEIICIDDASTDKTLMIADSIAKRDNRICVLKNQSNKGLSYTRNRGMDVANGKYIYFLDSDDMIKKDAIQELWDEAEGKELDVVFFDGEVIYENERLEKSFIGYSQQHFYDYNPIMKGKEAFSTMQKNREWAVNVYRQFWKRKFLQERNARFENGIIHEDELFSTLIIMEVQRCSIIKQKLHVRRLRENSIMTSEKSKEDMRGYFKCLCKLIEYLNGHIEEGDTFQEINRYLNTIKGYIVAFLLKHNDWEIEADNSIEFTVKKMLELEVYRLLSKQDIYELHQASNILIYGAGKAANQIFDELSRFNIYPDGFVVTNKDDKSNILLGLPVEEISECSKVVNSVVIIAIKDKAQVKEVRELLNQYDMHDVIIPQF